MYERDYIASFILEDVAQGVYVTDGRISVASEEGCDVYANVLSKLS